MLLGMSKQFRPYDPHQQYLFPPSISDWVPEDHIARFIGDVVDNLDLSAILAKYERQDGRGAPAYHPAMMVRLLVYGYCTGVRSSRRIERATYDDVAFRFLSTDQHPDHDSISEFRKRHLRELAALFLQVLKLCQKAGLVKLGHVALDGTKMKANASKHKAMSYDRMCKAEKELQEEIRRLLHEAEQADQEEDSKYGKGKRGDELPEELARKESRLKKIQEAKAALEQEAREAAERQAEEATNKNEARKNDPELLNRPANRRGQDCKVPDPSKAVPAPKAQKNFTDPESRIMIDGATKGFIQAYNAHIAVDSHSQIVVAAQVIQNTTDNAQLVPMVAELKANTGRRPRIVLADAGFFNGPAFEDPIVAGIGLYIPLKQREGSFTTEAASKVSQAGRMRAKLATARGKAIYKFRKAIVEPVFGQTKEARGFRHFLFRGVEKVRYEWQLICLTHNLLKLFRARKQAWA